MRSAVLFVVVLLILAALVGCSGKAKNTDDIDGGVRHRDDVDAPKTITSTQIVSFSCEFSTLSMMEETPLGNDVFSLVAVLTDGAVTGSCKSREAGAHTFETDAAFMERLQEIVAQYDFAQFNGKSYRVSGLPDQFGAYLDITYESEENIYASNNQDCFLELAAMEALWELFFAQTE